MESGDRHTRKPEQNEPAASNVVRLRRAWRGPEEAAEPASGGRFDSDEAWFGSREELVPFGPSAGASSAAEDFWGERSAAIQSAVRPPIASRDARQRSRAPIPWRAVLPAIAVCAGAALVAVAIQTEQLHRPAVAARSSHVATVDTESARATGSGALSSPGSRHVARRSRVSHRETAVQHRRSAVAAHPALAVTSSGATAEPASYSRPTVNVSSGGGVATSVSASPAASSSSASSGSGGPSSGSGGPSGSAPFGPGYPG